jgi:FkbM family methyltransferase
MGCSSCGKKRSGRVSEAKTIFRAGSWDQNIWNSVYKNNGYGIKRGWAGSVIDVGGHTGSFTKFILEKGARKVWTIEPDPGNFELLSKNLANYVASNKVVLINKAIGPAGQKFGPLNDPGENTGGVAYGESESGTIDTITLDDIIDDIPGPILMKIDCEGCEYFAITQIQKLARINAIVGEYHHRGEFNELTLRDHLVSNGFQFSHTVKTPTLGGFSADRA